MYPANYQISRNVPICTQEPLWRSTNLPKTCIPVDRLHCVTWSAFALLCGIPLLTRFQLSRFYGISICLAATHLALSVIAYRSLSFWGISGISICNWRWLKGSRVTWQQSSEFLEYYHLGWLCRDVLVLVYGGHETLPNSAVMILPSIQGDASLYFISNPVTICM